MRYGITAMVLLVFAALFQQSMVSVENVPGSLLYNLIMIPGIYLAYLAVAAVLLKHNIHGFKEIYVNDLHSRMNETVVSKIILPESAATMREHVEKALLLPRLCAALLGIFGAAGLLLAMVGLYGVMSYSVRSRTREIGIRIALGAEQRSVLQLVTRQGLAITAAGLTIGIAMAFALSRFLATMLYGVSPTDKFTFLVVPSLLLAVAAVAVFIPARRASRVDPLVSLRYE